MTRNLTVVASSATSTWCPSAVASASASSASAASRKATSALLSATVGATVIRVVVSATVAAYSRVAGSNAGASAPSLSAREPSVASADADSASGTARATAQSRPVSSHLWTPRPIAGASARSKTSPQTWNRSAAWSAAGRSVSRNSASLAPTSILETSAPVVDPKSKSTSDNAPQPPAAPYP